MHISMSEEEPQGSLGFLQGSKSYLKSWKPTPRDWLLLQGTKGVLPGNGNVKCSKAILTTLQIKEYKDV